MLEVGNMATLEEDRSHFGAWVIVSSPLILGYDINNRSLTQKIWPIISNVPSLWALRLVHSTTPHHLMG
jgi:hypothetical protein